MSDDSDTLVVEPPTIKVEHPEEDFKDTLVLLSDADLLESPEQQPPSQVNPRLLFISMPNKKVVRYGPFAKTQQDAPRLIIGRASHVHIQIDHREISRKHVEISYADGLFLLKDLRSSGGTYFNGVRVSSLRIEHGMEVQLAGSVTLRFGIGKRK